MQEPTVGDPAAMREYFVASQGDYSVRPCTTPFGPSSAIAPASPKGAYFWCSTSGTPGRCIHAVVRTFKFVPDKFVEPATPGFSSCPYKHNIQKKPARGGLFYEYGVPKGIRTPVTAVKGRCPRPTRRWGHCDQ